MLASHLQHVVLLLKLFERAALSLPSAMAVPYAEFNALHGTARAKLVRCRMRKRQISTKRTAAQALCHHSFCSLLKLSERAALFLTGAMAVPYAEFNALHGTARAKSVQCRMRKRHISKPH
jgi:hypothetical protein